MSVLALLAAGLLVALPGCLEIGDGRSAAAVCEVWNEDGKALHDRFMGISDTAEADLPRALGELATAPGRVATLMEKMAAVAPRENEPAFLQLASAFRAIADNMARGATDPFAGLAGGMALVASSQGSYDEVNTFLARNCGIPGVAPPQQPS